MSTTNKVVPHFMENIIDVIRNEFAKRKEKNPSYSLRAFARFVGVSPTALSQILSGKRKITPQAAAKIADKCELAQEQTLKIIAQASGIKFDEHDDIRYRTLSSEEFAMLSDWYYYAILSLCECADEKLSGIEISDRLGISLEIAQTALANLINAGVLKETNERYVQTGNYLTTQADIADPAVRKYHKQILQKVIASLDSNAVEAREITAITMAIEREKIGLAKELIREFLKRIGDALSTEEADDVYTMQVSLIPLTTDRKSANDN